MRIFAIILNFLTTILLIGWGTFTAAVAASDGKMPNKMSMIIVIGTAVAAAMKETRSFIGLPPLSNGNYEAIGKLLRDSNKHDEHLPRS